MNEPEDSKSILIRRPSTVVSKKRDAVSRGLELAERIAAKRLQTAGKSNSLGQLVTYQARGVPRFRLLAERGIATKEIHNEEDERAEVQDFIIRTLKELTFLPDGELCHFTAFVRTCRSILAVDYLDEPLDFLLRTVDVDSSAFSEELRFKMEEIREPILLLKTNAKSPAIIAHLDRLDSCLHDPNDDTDAYDPDFYPEFSTYLPLALAGNLAGQVNLGIIFENGEHPGGEWPEDQFTPDYEQAIYWYRLAAEAGDADGQYNLGDMYEYGKGVHKDTAEALAWYQKAARQGHANAAYRLGVYYANGIELEKDNATAALWFMKAAELGDADAQYCMGRWCAKGIEVAQDENASFDWLMKAAEQGHLEAQFSLSCCFKHGRGCLADEAESLRWCQLAAEGGHAKAQHNMGFAFETGEGVEMDLAAAAEWYELAANQGLAESRIALVEL